VSPKVHGTELERDWRAPGLDPAAVDQHSEGRGATIEVVIEIAVKAGCVDRRDGNRCTGWVRVEDGRWAIDGSDRRGRNEDGVNPLRFYYAELGRLLPTSLARLPGSRRVAGAPQP